jgi:hypothetical protein
MGVDIPLHSKLTVSRLKWQKLVAVRPYDPSEFLARPENFPEFSSEFQFGSYMGQARGFCRARLCRKMNCNGTGNSNHS